MDTIGRKEIATRLREVSHEAAELYKDEPSDYKGRQVKPQVVATAGENQNHIDMVDISLRLAPGKKILDVGIAYGIYAVVMKKYFGFEPYGIDHPDNIRAYCRYPIQKGIPVHECDLHFDAIPFPDNYFDLIIAAEIVEHLLVDPKVVFSKLYSVLKPHGRIIVTTPNFSSLSNIQLMIRGLNPTDPFPDDMPRQHQFTDPRVHPREYTVKEIEKSLSFVGFDIESIRTLLKKGTKNLSWRAQVLRWLMRFTPNHRDRIVAVGAKQNR